MPLQPDDVRSRLNYARARIDDLLALNRGDLPGADGHERQRLTQEAFFHLVGAIEVFAQLVNERRHLGRTSEDVRISRLAGWLDPADPLCGHIDALYWNTREDAPDTDPYDGDGLMYRIWNYRHQVTHRGANPFFVRLPLGRRRSPRRGFWTATGLLDGLRRSRPAPDRSGHFLTDPRLPHGDGANVSARTVHVEMDTMYRLVQDRLEDAIAGHLADLSAMCERSARTP